jgi:predicted kinase
MSTENRVAVLHLICGLPGSGKSTLARRLETELGAVRLGPDEWLSRLEADFYDEVLREKIEALQWQLTQRLLTIGNAVILENGFWSRAERDLYRSAANKIGAATKIHFLDVPIPELKRRLRQRNTSGDTNSPPVDPADLDRWVLLFEPPGEDELG